MKKICFITQCTLPIPTVKGGAVETLVEYILDENEKNPKYKFTVISVMDSEAQEYSKKYKYTDFVYIKTRNKNINNILNYIQRCLQHINISSLYSLEFLDIMKKLETIPEHDIYVYEAGPTTQIPLLGKKINKEKFLVHIHWDGMGTKKKDQQFSKLIPVSNYIGKQWEKATDCDASKIIPLYNCAKIERFDKKLQDNEKIELKKKLGIPVNNKVIIFTGRIVPEKGIKELLQAYQHVDIQDVTLLIIGSANFGSNTNTQYEKEIDEIIKKSSKSIIFTGFVHQTKLYQYYNIADIAVMPSMFEDPAPLVCIETQATGTPLIATDVGGISEYIDCEGTILIKKDKKLVTNLTKKINYLLKNPEKCKKMGNINKRNASKYNTKKYFERFCEIMEMI